MRLGPRQADYDLVMEQIPSAAALVEAGLGISALPALTLTMIKGARLVTKPLSDPVMQRRIGVVTLSGRAWPDHLGIFVDDLRRSLDESAS